MFLKKGDGIQFISSRLTKGNPVKGKFISEDKKWITIELSHAIEGINNYWDEGEEKTFRKELITELKKLN